MHIHISEGVWSSITKFTVTLQNINFGRNKFWPSMTRPKEAENKNAPNKRTYSRVHITGHWCNPYPS